MSEFFHKKILHVIGPRNGWGIHNRAELLAEAMNKLGFESTIASVHAPSEWADLSRYDHIHVHSLVLLENKKFASTLVNHPFWTVSVVSERSLGRLRTIRDFLKNAMAMVVKNPRLAELPEISAIPVPKVFIPNGVNPDVFHPVIRVGWAGRKDNAIRLEYKGVPLIQAAIELLNRERPDGASFVFQPDPSDYPSKVLSPASMAEFFNSIDILVCASEAEGCSNVVMEALACGIPVVSTDCGIARELCREDGLIILCERLVGCIASAIQLEMLPRLKNRQKFIEKYSWSRIAEQYAALFRGVEVCV